MPRPSPSRTSSSRKPRTTALKVVPKAPPTHDEIARRAFEFYLLRGDATGSEVNDWLRAESELRAG